MCLQLINRKRVSHFFQEIDDVILHCGADERVGGGEKGEKIHPCQKKKEKEAKKVKSVPDYFIYFSHCRVLLKINCNHRTIYFGIIASCLSIYHSVQNDFA